jgi:hypothetical protein
VTEQLVPLLMVQVAPGVKLPEPLLENAMVSPTMEPKLPDAVPVHNVPLPTVTGLVAQLTVVEVVASTMTVATLEVTVAPAASVTLSSNDQVPVAVEAVVENV